MNASDSSAAPQINFKPIGDNIAVVLDSRKTETSGGIALPEVARRAEEWGVVIATGDTVPQEDIKPGDRVFIPSHLGTHQIVGGVDFIIIERRRVACREVRGTELLSNR